MLQRAAMMLCAVWGFCLLLGTVDWLGLSLLGFGVGNMYSGFWLIINLTCG